MIRRFLITAALVAALACSAVVSPPNGLPIPRLTPGATFPRLSVREITASGFSRKHRNVTAATRRRVLRAYHFSRPSREFELDHLVPLCLGGSNDARNLWPEPYAATLDGRDVGARVKDRLEAALLRQVRSHTVALDVAQREIAANWITCYRRRLGELPRSN